MALIYNASFDSQTRILSLLDKAGNVVSSCEVPSKELVDDPKKPLMFRAIEDGSTVKLTKSGSPTGSFQTSRDGGKNWTDYTIGTVIALNTGDEVSFRAKANRSAQNADNYFNFEMTGEIEAWHNVMSMIRTNDFATYKTAMDFSFYRLFQSCTSLLKAPVLPATTLAGSCYYDMFGGCSSLTEAPALPATTLAVSCYNGIFYSCSSLIKSPELPATTLADDCYGYMFSGCRRLNEVRCQMPSSYSSSYISSIANNWLNGVSSTGTFYTNADANWTSGASGIPEGWTRVNEEAKDDITKPLTFRATQDGSTVTLTKSGTPAGSFQTSRDGGNTWADYTLNTAITLNTGDEVSFRAKANRSAQNYQNYFYFEMTGKIEAWHNVMSMLRTNDFSTYESVVESGLRCLFESCTSLTKAPVLPATTLDRDCYELMFAYCRSLTKAPVLPATKLVYGCYSEMFAGCQSLTKAPVLPATTLAGYCYYHMFADCLSLTKAPVLPATTLADSCYWHMFADCQSLTKAPVLPATTLDKNCYNVMFAGCRSLKEVRVSATTTATNALGNWLLGVAATGNFYCDPNAKIFPTDSASGIPKGWTRLPLSDYPNP